MNKILAIGVTAIGILVTTDGIGDSFCDNLQEFYRTKLFALETQMSILTCTRNISNETKEEINILKDEKNIIKRRLKACEKYNQHHNIAKSYYKKLSRRDIDLIAEKKARKYGINSQLVKSIIKAESNYDIYARSRAGAMGLMQLMPETAEEMGVENPWEPEENIEGGTKYFCLMLQEFKNVKDALIAYNAGPQVVRRKRKVPRESTQYVKNVLSNYRRFSGSETLN